MKAPTQSEIEAEIVKLHEILKGQLAGTVRAEVEIMVEALTAGFDQTSAEYGELSPNLQMAADDAIGWKDGLRRMKPSESI